MATKRAKEVLTTKVTAEEKASFLYLCTREGLKPAPALHSLVLDAIEKGNIIKVNRQQAISGGDTMEENDKVTSQKPDYRHYMALHGIKAMWSEAENE